TGHPRCVSRQAAPRREPRALGTALHRRHHLPRRGVRAGASAAARPAVSWSVISVVERYEQRTARAAFEHPKAALQVGGIGCGREVLLFTVERPPPAPQPLEKGVGPRAVLHQPSLTARGAGCYRCHAAAAFGRSCIPGRYWPASARNAIERRFQPLIATTASARLTSSSSLKCSRAVAYTASGTWPWSMRVSASHHSSAARSRP